MSSRIVFNKQQKISAAEVILEEITENNSNIEYFELLCYCQLSQESYNDAKNTYKHILSIDKHYYNEDFDSKLKVSTSNNHSEDIHDEDAISFFKKTYYKL